MTLDAQIEDKKMATLARLLRRCVAWTMVTVVVVMVGLAGFLSIHTFRLWQQLPSAADIAVHYTMAGEKSVNLLSRSPPIPKRMQQSVLAAEDPAYLQSSATHFRCLWDLLTDQQHRSSGPCLPSISDTASRLILADLRPANVQAWPARWFLMTLKLEANFSRKQILDLYIRHAYFGRGAYGADNAARAMYGIPASRLNLAQAAMLAAMLRSPAGFDPARHPGRAKRRRDLVIETMTAHGMISPSAGLAAQSAPIVPGRAD